jgi:hypothetical protein
MLSPASGEVKRDEQDAIPSGHNEIFSYVTPTIGRFRFMKLGYCKLQENRSP